jgi:hypothetical protein
MEVALNVQQELQSRRDAADRLRHLQVDRARYESELARRRFLRVDPDNRLVAASLEVEWNSKLRALSEAEENYERQCEADQLRVSAVQREQVLALATNFPQLWNDPGTADRERKRMVRLLIEDVTVRKGEQVQLDVRFRGGMSKTLMLPRPLSYCESHKQNPAMVAEMDRLLDDYNYADVARILNEKGFKTGDGLPLASPAVGSFERPTDSKAASIGFVNEACLPSLRLHDGAASQPIQSRIGDEGVEFVRMPLTVETNFSLKIPGPIHPGSTLEEFRLAIISGTQHSIPC